MSILFRHLEVIIDRLACMTSAVRYNLAQATRTGSTRPMCSIKNGSEHRSIYVDEFTAFYSWTVSRCCRNGSVQGLKTDGIADVSPRATLALPTGLPRMRVQSVPSPPGFTPNMITDSRGQSFSSSSSVGDRNMNWGVKISSNLSVTSKLPVCNLL